jgi:biotin synthase
LKTVIKRIKEIDLAITLSIGEYPRDIYRELKQAGADRFLLRHETADPDLYEELHPGYKIKDRINALKILKEEGYEVGCGFMVGLPGQTLDILAKDVLLCKDIEADMVGIGPFIPHPDTILKDEKQGDFQMTLRLLAAIRLVCRDVHLPATTAMATIDEFGREKAWQAGANVVMPTATPKPYRQAYELYPDKKCLEDSVEHCRGCLEMRILSVGRKVGIGQGGSYKKKKK